MFKKANGGRYNVYASHSGFVDFKRADIDAFNALSEEITLATCLPGASVTEGDQIATLKIIPFYVSESLVSVVELVLQKINLTVRSWQSSENRTGPNLERYDYIKNSKKSSGSSGVSFEGLWH